MIKIESPSPTKHHMVGLRSSAELVLPPLTEIKKNDEAPLTPVRINQLQSMVTDSGSSGSDLINTCKSEWNLGSSLLSMDKTPQTSCPPVTKIFPRRLEFSPGPAAGGTSTAGSIVSRLSNGNAEFGKQTVQAEGSDVGWEASMEEEDAEELVTFFTVTDYILRNYENKEAHELMETIQCAFTQDWSISC